MLPYATTRVDLYRPVIGDGDEPAVRNPYRQGLPAVLHTQGGTETLGQGQSEQIQGRLTLDGHPGLKHWDQVYDRTTQEWWEVTWVRVRNGLGLDHVEAGLQAVQGVSIG
jgi:hypothetical protein